MIYQKELDQILIAAETFDEAVFGLADMVHWQDDALDHFVDKKILQRTKPASEAECDGCEEKCVEKVVFVDGKKPSDTRAYIVCRMRDDMRPIVVDMERLKRWKANKDKLIELGYLTERKKSVDAASVVTPKVGRGRPITDNKKENARKICDFIENSPKEIPTIGKWAFLVDKFKFPYASAKKRRGEALKTYLKRNHPEAHKHLQ